MVNLHFVGPTDDRGNTIINRPMSVGVGADAGPGGIAIGAFAGGGKTKSPTSRQGLGAGRQRLVGRA